MAIRPKARLPTHAEPAWLAHQTLAGTNTSSAVPDTMNRD